MFNTAYALPDHMTETREVTDRQQCVGVQYDGPLGRAWFGACMKLKEGETPKELEPFNLSAMRNEALSAMNAAIAYRERSGHWPQNKQEFDTVSPFASH